MTFQYEADARKMMADLGERLGKFSLALHEDKTRLIEFGRFPALRRREHGERRCATFAFLGFTHYCAWIGCMGALGATHGRYAIFEIHQS
jgi:hypothetical protein